MPEIRPDLERMLSRLPGVYASVRKEGDAIAARARAGLLQHRQTGASRIEIDRHRPDVVVSLVDVAAVSIEYGRAGYFHHPWGIWIGPAEGIFVLHKAARI